MKKSLRTLIFMTMFMAVCLCGSYLYAQQPPSSLERGIGMDPRPGGKLHEAIGNVLGGYGSAVGANVFYGNTFSPVYVATPPVGTQLSGAVIGQATFPSEYKYNDLFLRMGMSASYPPIREAYNSSVMFVYTQLEMGTAGAPCRITKLRMPVAIRNSGVIIGGVYQREVYDAAKLSDSRAAYMSNESYTEYISKDPTPIKIYMRNAAPNAPNAFTRETNIFKTEVETNWENPFTGFWDYTTNNFTIVEYAPPTSSAYNNNDYWFLEIDLDKPFYYTGGDLWVAISNTVAESNWYQMEKRYYSYTFLCFATLDNNAGVTNPDPYYNMGRYLGPKWATNRINYDWTQDNTKSTTADPLIYTTVGDYPLVGASYRPSVIMVYAMMAIEGATVAALPNVLPLNNNLHAVASFNIATRDNDFPFKLRRINFSTAGITGDMLNARKAILYKATSLRDTVRVAEVNLTSSATTYSFDLTAANYILSDTTNKFWICYEVDEVCGGMLSFTANSYEVGDRIDPTGITGDADKQYTLNVNQTATKEIHYDVFTIENNNITYNVCHNDGVNTYTISLDNNVRGSYSSATWYRSSDNGATWNIIPNATGSSYTFAKDLQITKYRCVLGAPDGCTPLRNEVVYTIFYQTRFTNLSISYGAGSPSNLNAVEAGMELPLTSTYSGGYNASLLYRWEISYADSDLWFPISGAAGSNLADYTYYVPYDNTRIGRQKIRLTLIDRGSCQDTMYSNILEFTKITNSLDFSYIEQPGAATSNRLSVCDNGPIELYVIFDGTIIPTRSRWQKDGVDILDENGAFITSNVLSIPHAHLNSGGKYRYAAAAVVSRGTGGRFDTVFMYSAPCDVFVAPPLEILDQPQEGTYYAVAGKVLIFKVTSTFFEDKSYDIEQGFQWYIHRKAIGDVKLSDDHLLKGTRSNALVFVDAPNPDDDRYYAYNDDYYFLRVTDICGYVDSKPIYLLPSENMAFINQPSNVYVCNIGDRVSFSVDVDYSNLSDIRYKWYNDGYELTDNARISGTDARTLVINPTELNDYHTRYFCIASLRSNPNVFIKSREVGMAQRTMELTNKVPMYDEVSINTNENQLFGLSWTANHFGSNRGTIVYFVNGVEKHRLDLTDISGGSIRIEVKTDDLVVTDTLFTLMLIDDCNNTISANWRISVTENDGFNGNNSSIEDGEDLLLNSVVITPNPVTDEIEISFVAENAQLKIQLCDLTGTAVATLFDGDLQAGANKLKFSLQNLNIPSGTYFIKILNKSINVSKQFLFIR